MTAYSATKIPTALYPGDVTSVWDAESPATGSKSRQVALFKSQSGTPQGFSVQIIFSGAPGTFEIDVETSDTDADADYVLIAGGNFTAVNANQVARGEFQTTARFARLNMVNDPGNSVTVTGTIGQ